MKNTLIIIGVVLIALSIIGLAMGGFSITERETLVDIGPLEVTGETERHYPIPPIVNYALLAGGAAMVIGGAMSRKA